MKRILFLFLFFVILVHPGKTFAQSSQSVQVPSVYTVVDQLHEAMEMLDSFFQRISSRMNKTVFTEVQSSIVGSQYERLVGQTEEIRESLNDIDKDIGSDESGTFTRQEYVQIHKNINNTYQGMTLILTAQKRLVSELLEIEKQATPSVTITPGGIETYE